MHYITQKSFEARNRLSINFGEVPGCVFYVQIQKSFASGGWGEPPPPQTPRPGGMRIVDGMLIFFPGYAPDAVGRNEKNRLESSTGGQSEGGLSSFLRLPVDLRRSVQQKFHDVFMSFSGGLHQGRVTFIVGVFYLSPSIQQ